MDQRRALMAIGSIIILLLAVVFGVAYYSSKSARKAPAKASPSPTSGTQTVPQQSDSPEASGEEEITPDNSNLKTYTGVGFQFKYPANWGRLQCSNSVNLEFDPDDSIDQLGVACDRAVKPITVLVSSQPISCPGGESIKLGFNNVTKFKTTKPNGDVNFRWCINGAGSSLDISHRYSTTGAKASSNVDYSTAVEQTISTLSFGSGS